jgi:hypothetical protein
MNSKNPFAPLLQKLSGLSKPPSHALQGCQQFMKVAYEDKIKPVVEEEWRKAVEDGATGSHTAAFRARIAIELFDALPTEEQAALKKQAADEKKAAVEAYEYALKQPASKKLTDRQK